MADDLVDLMKPFRDALRGVGARAVKLQSYGPVREVQRRPGAKAHVRIDITPDEGPFLDISEKGILGPVAAAVLAEIHADFDRLTATVDPETIAFRRDAERALARGEPWAVRRYDGGRTGRMPPTGSIGAMFDSGRFRKSIVSAVTGTKPVRISINCAANRLDRRTFTPAAWERYQAQLERWLPALAKPGEAFNRPDVQRSLRDVLHSSVQSTWAQAQRERAKGDAKVRQLQAGLLQLARTVGTGFG